jgi:hypothetical protein
MLLTKRIVSFLLWFALIYGLLTGLWFSWGEYYAKGFIIAGDTVFSSFGSKGIVRFFSFQSKTPQTEYHDVTILLANQETVDTPQNGKKVPVQWLFISSRDIGYTSTILLIALILATPIRWLRKGWSLLGGMILIHVFIAFKLTILLLLVFSTSEQVAVMSLSSFWQSVLKATYEIFIANLSVSYVVPVFIWILVTFRRSDWQRLEQMWQKNAALE